MYVENNPRRWFLTQYSARKLAGNAQFPAGTWGKMAGICCRNSMTVSGCQNWSEPAGNGRNFTGNVHRTRMGKLRQEINGNSADQAGSGRTATTWAIMHQSMLWGYQPSACSILTIVTCDYDAIQSIIDVNNYNWDRNIVIIIIHIHFLKMLLSYKR